MYQFIQEDAVVGTGESGGEPSSDGDETQDVTVDAEELDDEQVRRYHYHWASNLETSCCP